MKNSTLLVMLLLVAHLIYSQHTIPASGKDIYGSGGSFNYSIGQLVYNTNIGNAGTITQGVQQSFEIITLSKPKFTTVNLKAVLYPNPTSKDVLLLLLTDTQLSNLSYTLYDIQSKTITKGLVTQTSIQIEMKDLTVGVYILKVNQMNQELKTFKIIKK